MKTETPAERHPPRGTGNDGSPCQCRGGLHLGPAVVELGVAHRDVLRREGHGDGHRHFVVHVECLLVVDDVGVPEVYLLHLRVLVGLLVDDLAINGLELAVEHGLDGRGVLRGLHRDAHASAGDARRGLALAVRVAAELVV